MKARILFVKLHRYLAFLAGGVIVIIALSGSSLVFKKEIDDGINGRVAMMAASGQSVSLEAMIQTVRAAYPGVRIARIIFPDRPDDAFEFVVSEADESWLCVSVNPYTGEILNSRPPGILEFLRELHSTLLVGRVTGSGLDGFITVRGDLGIGQYVVGLFGLSAITLCVTGLYLSSPGRRKLSDVLKINRRLSWKRTNWDLHRVVGIVASLFILVAATSGSVLVFRELVRSAGSTAIVPRSTGPGEMQRLSVDHLLQRAEDALPGGRVIEIALPEASEAPLSVSKTFTDNTHAYGYSTVWLDLRTGAVVEIDDPREKSAGANFLGQTMNAIHTGRVAGLPGRILVLVTGLVPAALFATGMLIWWTKRRVRVQQNAQRLAALHGGGGRPMGWRSARNRRISDALSAARDEPAHSRGRARRASRVASADHRPEDGAFDPEPG
ncbi:PepSY-associated TM helix domain-containing protein [Rhodospirillaceae bacterium SYSU D60014]|uniref:PepSY-associated TM helix domain-containing protein n=1 Tax=Virgifigura deserti TaxID=2268457 RepID=UPI000E667F79